MWNIAIAAGASALSTFFGGGNASAINAQNRAIAHENKRIVKANLENTIRTGFRVGILNIQHGQNRMALADAGASAERDIQAVMSANSANAAAAGTIGASVDAVETDIEQKIGETRNQLAYQWDIAKLNYETELASIIDQGKQALQGATGTVQKTPGGNFGTALLQGALTGVSMYAQGRMSLGLGSGSGGAGTQAPAPVRSVTITPATNYSMASGGYTQGLRVGNTYGLRI